MKKLNGDTTFDRIQKYYLKDGGVTLTPKEEEIRQRCEVAFGLFRESYSVEQSARMLITHFKISRSRAYAAVRMAISLYADVAKTSKEGIRNIVHEMAMQAFQIAKEKKDVDQMNKSIANIIKIKGLDKDESMLPDFGKEISQTNIVIVTNPREIMEGVPTDAELEKVIKQFKIKKRQIIPIEPTEDGSEENLLQ
jgi:hypothetical protein